MFPLFVPMQQQTCMNLKHCKFEQQVNVSHVFSFLPDRVGQPTTRFI